MLQGGLHRNRSRIRLDDVVESTVAVGKSCAVAQHRQRSALISLEAHLLDIPVGAQIAEVNHTHIGAIAFHLLGIPQRESVIVAVGENNAVFAHARQIVHAEVATSISTRAVVVIPSLAHHLQRHEHTDKRCNRSHNDVATLVERLVHLLEEEFHQIEDSGDTHTHPDSECVERTGKSVVAFARLAWSLVEVEHDSDTCHEEQEENHPELLNSALVLVSLPEQTGDTEQKREHEEHIVPLVTFAEVAWQQRLVAESRVVDKRDTRNPVAVSDFAGTLDIVLPTHKIPHKVAPIHVIELVVEEESEVLEESGLGEILAVDRLPFGIDASNHLHLVEVGLGDTEPFHIERLVAFAVQAREKHIQLGSHHIVLLIAVEMVEILLLGRSFHPFGIERLPLIGFGAGHPVGVVLIHHRRIESLPIEERFLPILLAVEITAECKHVVGGVLVHRSVGI